MLRQTSRKKKPQHRRTANKIPKATVTQQDQKTDPDLRRAEETPGKAQE